MTSSSKYTELPLRDYQKTGIDFLVKRKNAYLADDMGLGKTLQACHAARRMHARQILVLCPATVKEQWGDYLKAFFPDQPVEVVYGKNGMPHRDSRSLVINYDLLNQVTIRRPLLTWKFDLLICDEAHYLKNHEANRTVFVLGKGGLVYNSSRRWLLSGTPIFNRPIDLYCAIRVLFSHAFADYLDYERFARRYCQGRYGPNGFEAKGASNQTEFKERIKDCILKRVKEEVAKELPQKTLQPVIIEPKCIISPNKTEISEYQLAGLDKVLNGAKAIRNYVENSGKVVVFVHHKEVRRLLSERVGLPYLHIDGETPPERRKWIVHQFQKDPEIQVLYGQTQATGIGLDGLQHATNVCVFFEIPWTPGMWKQAMDRLHRLGQEKPVFVYYFIGKGSMDEGIIRSLQNKIDWSNSMIENHKEEKKMSLEESINDLNANIILLCKKLDKLMEQPSPVPADAKPIPQPEEPKAPAKKRASRKKKSETTSPETPTNSSPTEPISSPSQENPATTISPNAKPGDIPLPPENVTIDDIREKCMELMKEASNGPKVVKILEAAGAKKISDLIVINADLAKVMDKLISLEIS